MRIRGPRNKLGQETGNRDPPTCWGAGDTDRARSRGVRGRVPPCEGDAPDAGPGGEKVGRRERNLMSLHESAAIFLVACVSRGLTLNLQIKLANLCVLRTL